MNVKYRQYSIDDKSQILALLDNFQDHLINLDNANRLRRKQGLSEYYLEKMLKAIEENEGVFYVAEDDNKIRGFSIATVKRLNKQEKLSVDSSIMGRITDVYLEKDYRGKGIGSKLIELVETYLKSKRCDVIKIEVFAPNISAQKFYKKSGYTEWVIDLFKKV